MCSENMQQIYWRKPMPTVICKAKSKNPRSKYVWWSTLLISRLILMHISNPFVIVCNIQIVIRMWKIQYYKYYKFEYGSNSMVKLDLHYKPLFLFYRNLPCLFRSPCLFDFTRCSNPLFIRALPPVYSGPKSTCISKQVIYFSKDF